MAGAFDYVPTNPVLGQPRIESPGHFGSVLPLLRQINRTDGGYGLVYAGLDIAPPVANPVAADR